jgi:DNA-binding response OmpR family regulator
MKKILLIDDDARLVTTLSELLSQKFFVKSALDLKDAAKFISTLEFDAVICDFVLNDGNGIDVVKLIKTLQPRPKLIIITAFANKEIAIELLNHKVDAMLEKPFEFSDLLKTIENEIGSDSAAGLSEFSMHPLERTIRFGENTIELTDVEFKLFSYLTTQQDRWVAREDLIHCVWGGTTNSRNTLDTHLSNLKKKLPCFKMALKVVRGRGFCYSPKEISATV